MGVRFMWTRRTAGAELIVRVSDWLSSNVMRDQYGPTPYGLVLAQQA